MGRRRRRCREWKRTHYYLSSDASHAAYEASAIICELMGPGTIHRRINWYPVHSLSQWMLSSKSSSLRHDVYNFNADDDSMNSNPTFISTTIFHKYFILCRTGIWDPIPHGFDFIHSSFGILWSIFSIISSIIGTWDLGLGAWDLGLGTLPEVSVLRALCYPPSCKFLHWGDIIIL